MVPRVLLFVQAQVKDDEPESAPVASATETALRLWAHTFYALGRGENMLRVTKPQFIPFLNRSVLFKNEKITGSLAISLSIGW